MTWGGSTAGTADSCISNASGIYLNNGFLGVNVASQANTITKNITLEAGGGGVLEGYASSTMYLTGNITGPGAFKVAGYNTPTALAVVTGNNTYTGNTTVGMLGIVNSGAANLQVGNGGTTGNICGNLAIINSATNYVAFDRSDTITFPGVISGIGNVQQIGGGTLILTASNTYTGGTSVTKGTLQLGNGTNGSDGSLASLTIANSGTVAYDLFGSQTYAGAISGSGGVTSAGGLLIFTGTNNSYTGGTSITGGTLEFANTGLGVFTAEHGLGRRHLGGRRRRRPAVHCLEPRQFVERVNLQQQRQYRHRHRCRRFPLRNRYHQ